MRVNCALEQPWRAADRLDREHAGEDRADDAADPVNPERIQCVVITERTFEAG